MKTKLKIIGSDYTNLLENLTNKNIEIKTVILSNIIDYIVEAEVEIVKQGKQINIFKNRIDQTISVSVFLSKDNALILEPGDVLRVKSEYADSLSVLCSYNFTETNSSLIILQFNGANAEEDVNYFTGQNDSDLIFPNLPRDASFRILNERYGNNNVVGIVKGVNYVKDNILAIQINPEYQPDISNKISFQLRLNDERFGLINNEFVFSENKVYVFDINLLRSTTNTHTPDLTTETFNYLYNWLQQYWIIYEQSPEDAENLEFDPPTNISDPFSHAIWKIYYENQLNTESSEELTNFILQNIIEFKNYSLDQSLILSYYNEGIPTQVDLDNQVLSLQASQTGHVFGVSNPFGVNPDVYDCMTSNGLYKHYSNRNQDSFDCRSFAESMALYLRSQLASICPNATVNILSTKKAWRSRIAGHAMIYVNLGGICADGNPCDCCSGDYVIEPQNGHIWDSVADMCAQTNENPCVTIIHNEGYSYEGTEWQNNPKEVQRIANVICGCIPPSPPSGTAESNLRSLCDSKEINNWLIQNYSYPNPNYLDPPKPPGVPQVLGCERYSCHPITGCVKNPKGSLSEYECSNFCLPRYECVTKLMTPPRSPGQQGVVARKYKICDFQRYNTVSTDKTKEQCEENCPSPSGACCFKESIYVDPKMPMLCDYLQEGSCQELNGSWHMLMACSEISCGSSSSESSSSSRIEGACCFGNLVVDCMDGLTKEECENSIFKNTTWQEGKTCEWNGSKYTNCEISSSSSDSSSTSDSSSSSDSSSTSNSSSSGEKTGAWCVIKAGCDGKFYKTASCEYGTFNQWIIADNSKTASDFQEGKDCSINCQEEPEPECSSSSERLGACCYEQNSAIICDDDIYEIDCAKILNGSWHPSLKCVDVNCNSSSSSSEEYSSSSSSSVCELSLNVCQWFGYDLFNSNNCECECVAGKTYDPEISTCVSNSSSSSSLDMSGACCDTNQGVFGSWCKRVSDESICDSYGGFFQLGRECDLATGTFGQYYSNCFQPSSSTFCNGSDEYWCEYTGQCINCPFPFVFQSNIVSQICKCYCPRTESYCANAPAGIFFDPEVCDCVDKRCKSDQETYQKLVTACNQVSGANVVDYNDKCTCVCPNGEPANITWSTNEDGQQTSTVNCSCCPGSKLTGGNFAGAQWCECSDGLIEKECPDCTVGHWYVGGERKVICVEDKPDCKWYSDICEYKCPSSCTSPKVWNFDTESCECPKGKCSYLQTYDPETCECRCLSIKTITGMCEPNDVDPYDCECCPHNTVYSDLASECVECEYDNQCDTGECCYRNKCMPCEQEKCIATWDAKFNCETQIWEFLRQGNAFVYCGQPSLVQTGWVPEPDCRYQTYNMILDNCPSSSNCSSEGLSAPSLGDLQIPENCCNSSSSSQCKINCRPTQKENLENCSCECLDAESARGVCYPHAFDPIRCDCCPNDTYFVPELGFCAKCRTNYDCQSGECCQEGLCVSSGCSSSSSHNCPAGKVPDPDGNCVCEHAGYDYVAPKGYCTAVDQYVNPVTCSCECVCPFDWVFNGYKIFNGEVYCDCIVPSSSSSSPYQNLSAPSLRVINWD